MNQYHWDLEDPVMSIIAHHGILGQKWGVRRFQNEDGSLTEEGKRRLGFGTKSTPDDWKQDRIIAKGTKTTRVIKVHPEEYAYTLGDDEYYNDPKLVKKYMNMALKDRDESEKKYQDKYMSVINDPDNPNPAKTNEYRGDMYYIDWFGDRGWDIDKVVVDEFVAKKPLKVAAGEKVIEEIIKQAGDELLDEAYNRVNWADKKKGIFDFKGDNIYGGSSIDDRLQTLSQAYTTDRELKKKVDDTFKKLGYDAITDPNDRTSESPIIVFDSDKKFKKTNRSSAEDYWNRVNHWNDPEFWEKWEKEHPNEK